LDLPVIKPKTSRYAQGYLICLSGTVMWSFTAIFISYLSRTYQLPALVLAFWRDLFVAGALALFFIIARPALLRAGRANLGFLIAYGLVLTLFNSLWTVSVVFNGAAVSTVMAYSSAAFTAVLGWRLYGEQLGLRKITAVVLSITGTVLVAGALNPSVWRLNPLGIITGLLSGIAFAAYSLMGKAASQREINPWTTLLYTFSFAALFLLGLNLLGGNLPGGIATPNLLWLGGALMGWLVLFSLAVVPTIGGYGLYTVSLGYLPVSVANLIATLEPVMTAIWAFLLLGERLTAVQIFGSVLIITGVMLLRLPSEQIVGEP
jgi:drug/metabolite transporter (DMT)-like permease